MPRNTNTTKTTAQKVTGNLALAEDMSKHVVDDATTEAVAITVNVFEKMKTSPTSTPLAETDVANVIATEAKEEMTSKQPPELAQSPQTTSTPTAQVILPQGETITYISLTDLHPPDFHPFHVNDDEAMTRLAENIKQYGVREPGVVRPRKDSGGNNIGGYELLIGNRRKRACELAGFEIMPVIIRELDDADAVISMVDSNLEQRDRLLPSEKAWAYKIKMEALNHKGIKGDKLSAVLVAEQYGDSRSQVFRMMRLTDLVVGLLDKVDSNKLAFNPAVELASLSQTEQIEVVTVMEHNDMKPSLSQAVKLRKLKQEGTLTKELIRSVLSEVKIKTPAKDKEVIRYRKYFPNNFTATQIDEIILELLEEYQAKQIANAHANAKAPVQGESGNISADTNQAKVVSA